MVHSFCRCHYSTSSDSTNYYLGITTNCRRGLEPVERGTARQVPGRLSTAYRGRDETDLHLESAGDPGGSETNITCGTTTLANAWQGQSPLFSSRDTGCSWPFSWCFLFLSKCKGELWTRSFVDEADICFVAMVCSFGLHQGRIKPSPPPDSPCTYGVLFFRTLPSTRDF